jgi:hypothetical protein
MLPGTRLPVLTGYCRPYRWRGAVFRSIPVDETASWDIGANRRRPFALRVDELTMSIWLEAEGEPVLFKWNVMPGLEVIVSRIAGRLAVGYMLGADGDELFLHAKQTQMERSRQVFGLAFTYGQA